LKLKHALIFDVISVNGPWETSIRDEVVQRV